MSKFLQNNFFYVLQNKKYRQIEFSDIKDNQIFLFNGIASSDIHNCFIVFGYKRMEKTNILEVYHDEYGLMYKQTNIL
jgi:hypothetical protein